MEGGGRPHTAHRPRHTGPAHTASAPSWSPWDRTCRILGSSQAPDDTVTTADLPAWSTALSNNNNYHDD